LLLKVTTLEKNITGENGAPKVLLSLTIIFIVHSKIIT
jgi:hypothetical protein